MGHMTSGKYGLTSHNSNIFNDRGGRPFENIMKLQFET